MYVLKGLRGSVFTSDKLLDCFSTFRPLRARLGGLRPLLQRSKRLSQVLKPTAFIQTLGP